MSVEPVTVNGGVSFGSVQRNGRMQAELASGVTGATVGMFVVAAAQEAIGTQVNSNRALVKPGAAASQLGSGTYAYTAKATDTLNASSRPTMSGWMGSSRPPRSTSTHRRMRPGRPQSMSSLSAARAVWVA